MEANNSNSFVKQAAILAIAGIAARVIGFLYRVPLTNAIILDEGNGIYGASYSIYNFFLILSSAGLPVAISKMVSERYALNRYKNAHRVYLVALFTAAILGLICSLSLWFFAKELSVFIESPRSYYALLTLSPTIFIVALMAVYRGYFQGMGNAVPTALSQFIEQIFNAIFSVVCAYFLMKNFNDAAYGAAGGTAGTGIGAFAGLLVMLFVYFLAKPIIYKRFKHEKGVKYVESDKHILKELFKTAFPIIAGTAIFSFATLIDAKMVRGRLMHNNVFSDIEAYKLYGQLNGKYTTLITLPVAISTAFATASVPSIASSHVLKHKRVVFNKINTAIRLAMTISIPAAVGLGVLGRQILLFLYPNQPAGGSLIQIGAISIIFLALAQITTGMLQGVGKVYIPAIAALCGCLVKIPLNYVLVAIPSLNVNGAVIGTITCYFIVASIDIIALSYFTKVKLNYIDALVKPILSAAFMGLVCYVIYYCFFYLINSNTIAMLLSILCGVVSYFAFMLFCNGITEEDLKLLPMGKKLASFIKKL